MTDSEIIWSFLTRHVPNEHTSIYLYCCGNVRSPNTAKEELFNSFKQVFHNAMPEYLVKATIEGFLENKKRLYKSHQITIRPFY
jgi:hypothetical protein